jgi:hypothetical protein
MALLSSFDRDPPQCGEPRVAAIRRFSDHRSELLKQQPENELIRYSSRRAQALTGFRSQPSTLFQPRPAISNLGFLLSAFPISAFWDLVFGFLLSAFPISALAFDFCFFPVSPSPVHLWLKNSQKNI